MANISDIKLTAIKIYQLAKNKSKGTDEPKVQFLESKIEKMIASLKVIGIPITSKGSKDVIAPALLAVSLPTSAGILPFL